ncbi:MAG: tripartite tricarboxylate transporter permease [Bacillota bacterium]
MLEFFYIGLQTTVMWVNLLAIALGVVIGLIFGAIPGLSGVTAVGLLVPFTYGMSPVTGLLLMIGVYCAATYGGSISAILFNMPGDVMAAATVIDGYPMTLKGEAQRALAMAIFASFVGGIIGTVILSLVAPQFVKVALTFGSPEYFALAMLGLAIVGSIGAKSQVKALLGVTFGLWLSTIGLDPVSGISRFTLGNAMLQAGIGFIPAIIGFFAFSEIFARLYDKHINKDFDPKVIKDARILNFPPRRDITENAGTILRSSLLGNFVGILPGAGATIAAFLGYGMAARFSKRRQDFGTGIVEGIAAPESANNAAVGGAMVPLLTLGIPGSATTAVMLSVMILHGLRPGPLLFQRMPDLTYSVFVGMFLANVVMLVFGMFFVRFLIRLLLVRFEVLSLFIFVFCVFGAFSIYNRFVDVWVMFACGILGFFAKKFDFSIAAIILGLVLGSIAENGFVNGISVTRGDFGAFFIRPITLIILVFSVLFLITPFLLDFIRCRKEIAARKVAV